jgi:hypothetical protein
MARGRSGRIVIEVEPEFKDELYVSLARAKLTLKEWFIRTGEQFIRGQDQLDLFGKSKDEEKAPSPHEES